MIKPVSTLFPFNIFDKQDKNNRVGKGESHPQTSHRTVLIPLDSYDFLQFGFRIKTIISHNKKRG